jgi:GntR family transcriptional repressor for pyruvate dehydrogenase complex
MSVERNDYEKLIDYIEDKIIQKQLTGGDKLPSERDLSVRLEISRGAVRRGLMILEGMGIVENRHGSGNYITAESDRKLVQILTMMYTLDEMSFEEISVFRYAAELQAVTLAVQNISRAQKEKLLRYLDGLERSGEEEEKAFCDQMIHQTIVEASGSRLVIANYLALRGVLTRNVSQARQGVRRRGQEQERQFQEIHRRLVHGLCRGDFDAAKAALDEHFAFLREDPNS